MDAFPMQRMLFNGSDLIESPPTSEPTQCSVRDQGDPLKPVGRTYVFNLASEDVIEPWMTCEENRYP